jgi:hypothetical protein
MVLGLIIVVVFWDLLYNLADYYQNEKYIPVKI